MSFPDPWSDCASQVDQQWVVPIVHGYLEQKVLSVFGKSVYVTLVARRSRFFAGTRYLERGINGAGHVANDVETEQIVQTGVRLSSSMRFVLRSTQADSRARLAAQQHHHALPRSMFKRQLVVAHITNLHFDVLLACFRA